MVPWLCPATCVASRPVLDLEDLPQTTTDAGSDLSRAPLIGTVIFPVPGNRRAEAILDGQGRWHCPRLPSFARVLNALHEPKRGGDLPFGHAELIRVAAWVKGEARLSHPWTGQRSGPH